MTFLMRDSDFLMDFNMILRWSYYMLLSYLFWVHKLLVPPGDPLQGRLESQLQEASMEGQLDLLR